MWQLYDLFCYCFVLPAYILRFILRVYLWLDVRHFAPAELKLIEGHLGMLQVSYKPKLLGSKDQEGVTFAL